MRSITVDHDKAVLIRRWLLVIRLLVNKDAPHHLTRLAAEKVIPRNALPRTWEYGGEDDFNSLRDSIIWGRDELVSDIVLCTLPSLGIGDTWTLPAPSH